VPLLLRRMNFPGVSSVVAGEAGSVAGSGGIEAELRRQ
jgi:hypothetical protein